MIIYIYIIQIKRWTIYRENNGQEMQKIDIWCVSSFLNIYWILFFLEQWLYMDYSITIMGDVWHILTVLICGPSFGSFIHFSSKWSGLFSYLGEEINVPLVLLFTGILISVLAWLGCWGSIRLAKGTLTNLSKLHSRFGWVST